MAAEFDTQPDYATEDDDQTPPPAREAARDDRGSIWGTLALAVFAAIVLLVLLTQFTAKVPETVGLSRADAEAKLTQAGFAVGDVSEIPAGEGRPGTVAEQAPSAGTTVRKGTSVDLMVALGGNLVTVPDVSGQDSANASIELIQAGFQIASAEEYSDLVPTGVAVSQTPQAGTRASDGSLVTVFYSLGPQSAAEVNVARSDTDNGLSTASSGSSGSGADPLMMNCTRSYPGATAWSSNGDIYVRLSPGGAARRVTRTGDWDSSPVVSPNDRYLVFLRATGSGERATDVGAVCFTTMATHILTLPETDVRGGKTRTYGKPVFAPSEHSTTLDSDWIVLPQYWREDRGDGPITSARLLVCNVPMNSSWVSWNLQFRPAMNLSLGRSNRAGCVRVTQKSGSKTVYSRDFNATTGLYLR